MVLNSSLHTLTVTSLLHPSYYYSCYSPKHCNPNCLHADSISERKLAHSHFHQHTLIYSLYIYTDMYTSYIFAITPYHSLSIESPILVTSLRCAHGDNSTHSCRLYNISYLQDGLKKQVSLCLFHSSPCLSVPFLLSSAFARSIRLRVAVYTSQSLLV